MAGERLGPGDRRPGPPTSTPVSTRVRTLSSRKKGLPCVRAIRSGVRGARLGVLPQQRLEQASALAGGSGSSRSWRVRRLTAPAVLVLGAVVDQEQQPGRREALDQAIQHGLRLGVNPVQVFEDQQQRLHLAFAQQHALAGPRGCAGGVAGGRVPGTDCRRAGHPAAPAPPGRYPGGSCPASGSAQ